VSLPLVAACTAGADVVAPGRVPAS
jgi:hypothetical protein